MVFNCDGLLKGMVCCLEELQIHKVKPMYIMGRVQQHCSTRKLTD